MGFIFLKDYSDSYGEWIGGYKSGSKYTFAEVQTRNDYGLNWSGWRKMFWLRNILEVTMAKWLMVWMWELMGEQYQEWFWNFLPKQLSIWECMSVMNQGENTEQDLSMGSRVVLGMLSIICMWNRQRCLVSCYI